MQELLVQVTEAQHHRYQLQLVMEERDQNSNMFQEALAYISSLQCNPRDAHGQITVMKRANCQQQSAYVQPLFYELISSASTIVSVVTLLNMQSLLTCE